MDSEIPSRFPIFVKWHLKGLVFVDNENWIKISDPHDNIQNIRKAIRKFNDKHVDFVIHAGDFVNPIAVESPAGVKLVGVLGNNDTEIAGPTSTFDKIHGELKGEIFETAYDGMRFAIYLPWH